MMTEDSDPNQNKSARRVLLPWIVVALVWVGGTLALALMPIFSGDMPINVYLYAALAGVVNLRVARYLDQKLRGYHNRASWTLYAMAFGPLVLLAYAVRFRNKL